MSATIKNELRMPRETLQLWRLERLVDVIFALVIIRLFTLLPRPETMETGWWSLTDMLLNNSSDLLMILVGMVIVIIYWIQHNTLSGYLVRTNNTHTAIAIMQLFALLLFFYAIRMGSTFAGTVEARVLESGTAALVGIASVIGWVYATRNRRLVSTDLPEPEARDVLMRTMTEPAVALLTIPCAFIGPVVWEIAWLAFIPVSQIIKRLVPEPAASRDTRP